MFQDKRKKAKVKEYQTNLKDRLFDFAVKNLELLTALDFSPESKVLRTQLAKAATSSGANYEEAQAGCSKSDFLNKISISLKEMRESNYWLRIIKKVIKLEHDKDRILDELILESVELKKMLGSIIVKGKKSKIYK